MPANKSFQKIALFGKRVAALSAIGMIIIGNVWFIYRLTGADSPFWTYVALLGFLMVGLLGGLLSLLGFIKPVENIEEFKETRQNN